MELILNDVSEFIIDCEHNTAPTQEYGYPSIRTPNIGKGVLILDGVNRVSEEVYIEWTRRGKPQEGDLIIAREAPVGNVAVIPKNLKVCLGQRTVLVRPDKSIANPQYLCYLLLGDKLQGQILTQTTGATVAHLNMKDIRELKLPKLPSIPLQSKIASILSAYDELIEINKQRIKLLEEMAEEIYKEWFVRLRFPGYETAKFEDGLPEGWENTTLPKYIDFLEGPGLRNYQYTDSGIRYLNIRVMGNNDLFLDKAGFLDTDEVNKRYSHFLLNENDHVVSSSGTIGRVVTIRKSHLPLCLNTSIIRMRSKSEKFGTWLLKQFLKSQDFQGQISSFAIGAAQANFGPSHLSLMKMTSPTKIIALQFEKIVGPMEEEIRILLDKNQLLQQTRDLLLPRLISGKLSVEHLVEQEERLSIAAEPEVSYQAKE